MLHYEQSYDPSQDRFGEFVDRWNKSVRRTKVLTIALGTLLLLAGIASALSPFLLFAFIQTAVAAALVVGGIGGIAAWARIPELLRTPVPLVMGIMNALLGVMLLAMPSYITAGTLTLLLAFLFIAAGTERISTSRRMDRFGIEGSGVTLATGIVNVIAGGAFLLLPLFSSLMLGYLMAGYLFVGGACLLVEGISMKRIDR